MCSYWILCLVSLTVRGFLECLDPVSLPLSAERLFVCPGAHFNTLPGNNSAFAFTYWLSRTSRSARSERVGPFQVFPGYVHSPVHMHVPSRSLGICWRISKPLWAAHLLDFIQMFVLSFFLCVCVKYFIQVLFSCLLQLVLAPQAAVMLKNCCCVFLASTLGGGLFPVSELCIRSNKDKPRVCVFPESWQTVIILWEWAFGELQTCSASSSGWYFSQVLLLWGWQIFKATMEMGK